MNRLRIPYKKKINYLFLGFFGIPLMVFLFMFFEGNKSEMALKGIQWYGIPTLVLGALLLPLFEFKADKKVKASEALLKLPFIELYLLLILPVVFLIVFGGIASFLDGDKEPLLGLVIIGIGTAIPILAILNSNRVLFKGDYITQKDEINLQKRKATNGHFVYHENGFNFKKKTINFSTKWEEIEGIVAYKTDNFAYDTIHLIVETQNGDELNISEETDGWFVFKDKIDENLYGLDTFWEMKVMTPAFEENATLIYKKGENLKEKNNA